MPSMYCCARPLNHVAQIAAVTDCRLNFEFPENFKEWLDSLKLLNLDLFGDFSGTCLIEEFVPNFSMLYLKFTIYMLLPPILICAFVLSYNQKRNGINRTIQREITQQVSLATAIAISAHTCACM
eukprot:SAG11_NODE_235_length_11852_cov_4.266020_8_plen_125_part_00